MLFQCEVKLCPIVEFVKWLSEIKFLNTLSRSLAIFLKLNFLTYGSILVCRLMLNTKSSSFHFLLTFAFCIACLSRISVWNAWDKEICPHQLILSLSLSSLVTTTMMIESIIDWLMTNLSFVSSISMLMFEVNSSNTTEIL